VLSLTHGNKDMAPAWAPDGNRLVFTRNDILHLVDADGGHVESLGGRGGAPQLGATQLAPGVKRRGALGGEHVLGQDEPSRVHGSRGTLSFVTKASEEPLGVGSKARCVAG